MLVLTRRIGEKIYIGDTIVVTLVSVDIHGRARIGIEAPRHVQVMREELRDGWTPSKEER